MLYEYSDPTGITNTFTELLNGEVFQAAKLLPTEKRLNRLVNYKFGAVLAGDYRVDRTFEPISFPNPKRGFIAITTYPPVYQSKNGDAVQQLVVPRVYPPIYIEPRGRNQR